MTTQAQAHDFTSGDSQPDPVARLIAFDFYDGALAGVVETHGGQTYRFDWIDDWPTRGDRDSVRMFRLHRMADGAFDRLVELISPHSQQQVPYWVPSWWHLPDDAKQALDCEVDAFLASAGPADWVVAGHFLCQMSLRVRRVGPTPRTAEEWARVFELPDRPE